MAGSIGLGCDAPSLTLDDALRLIAEGVPIVAAAETVPLGLADGRVLAEPILAGIDLPPFDNAAVDGYALRSADLAGGPDLWPVGGRIAAGHAGEAPAGPGLMRVFTGARLPAGFDTVVRQEDARLEADGRVRLPPRLQPGADRRRAGEDIDRGALALPAGRRLDPAAIGLLGALGHADVPVRAPLRVALASTGDELAGAGEAVGASGRHDANRPMLRAACRRLGAAVTDLGILPDRAEAVTDALRGAAAGHDLVLTTGGVSVGEEDHVRTAVERLGRLGFWRLAVKPGRPVAMGEIGSACFLGLPGNPVAAFVTFAVVARPLMARLAGETWHPPRPVPVPAGFALARGAGRREFLRVRLRSDPDGRLVADKHPRDGSGMLTSLTETDGFVVLPEALERVAIGDPVGFVPYAAFL